MKHILVITFIITLFSCNDNNTTNESVASQQQEIDSSTITKKDSVKVNSDNLIEPGVNIGNTYVDEDASLLEQKLGIPDSSDAAMGKAWLFWYGKTKDDHNNRTELNIFTSYRDTSMNGKSVKQIRTTSSYFKTKENVHVYSSFTDIQKHYTVKKIGEYKANDGRLITLYDDAAKRIAFEIANAGNEKICTGIIIYTKQLPLLNAYLTYHPEMKIDSVK